MIPMIAEVGVNARAQSGKMEFSQTGTVQLTQSKKRQRVMDTQGGPKLLKMTEFIAYGDTVDDKDLLRIDGRLFQIREVDETLAGAMRIVVEDKAYG